MDRCAAQWRYQIEQVWFELNTPTEEEVRAWLDRLWACAEEKGIELSEPPRDEEWVEPVLAGCRPWQE